MRLSTSNKIVSFDRFAARAKSQAESAQPSAQESRGGLRLNTDSDSREFLPAALEIVETPPSPVSIALIWFICLACVAALGWSYFGKLDIHAVAQGKVQPSGRSKVVQPFEPGKVKAIFVDNGKQVRAGEVLLDLDSTEPAANEEAQAQELASYEAQLARLAAAISSVHPSGIEETEIPFAADISAGVRQREKDLYTADIRQLAASIDTLDAELAKLSAQRERVSMSMTARSELISVLKERVDARDTLDANGQGYRAKVIDALQDYERARTELANEQGQLIEIDAAQKSIQSKIEAARVQFIQEQTSKLSETARARDRISHELVKAKARTEHMRLKAPISGIVQQLAITTVGQVVSSGQALMTIVPLDAPIEIEAMIENSDVGFVKVGQPVAVKVDAFPFTRYGSLEGVISSIANDAVDVRDAPNLRDADSAVRPQSPVQGAVSATASTLKFPATIRVEQSAFSVNGQERRLVPGMTVTVECKTGQRRAIDYLLSPLREIRSAALHER